MSYLELNDYANRYIVDQFAVLNGVANVNVSGDGNTLVTLGEVARIELGSANDRSVYRGNGVDAVGIGIVKQSNANSLEVLRGAEGLAERIRPTLPQHMGLETSSSDAEFIENAISSVYSTIFITMALVSLVIYMFLGSLRVMLIPVVTIPVCLLSAFIVLSGFNLSINLIILLALVPDPAGRGRTTGLPGRPDQYLCPLRYLWSTDPPRQPHPGGKQCRTHGAQPLQSHPLEKMREQSGKHDQSVPA